MKNAKIRFIQEPDIDGLIELCKLHADYEKSEYSSENKKQMLYPHLFSNNPSVYCLVVEHNDKLIGFASYSKEFSTWNAAFYIHMDCLFMIEEARGFGLGEKLVDKIKEEGAKLQCDHIQWQTPDFNLRAIKFYNRIGGQSKVKQRYTLKI